MRHFPIRLVRLGTALVLAVAVAGVSAYFWLWLNDQFGPGAFVPQVLPASVLIARLTEVSEAGVGTDPSDWPPRFAGPIRLVRVGRAAPPAVHPAMRELIRRGLAALPELLGHVSDSRQTKL